MFITFDYLCPDCEHRETRFVRKSEMDDQQCPNYVAPNPEKPCFSMVMTRLPPATRTTFRFADKKLKR